MEVYDLCSSFPLSFSCFHISIWRDIIQKVWHTDPGDEQKNVISNQKKSQVKLLSLLKLVEIFIIVALNAQTNKTKRGLFKYCVAKTSSNIKTIIMFYLYHFLVLDLLMNHHPIHVTELVLQKSNVIHKNKLGTCDKHTITSLTLITE